MLSSSMSRTPSLLSNNHTPHHIYTHITPPVHIATANTHTHVGIYSKTIEMNEKFIKLFIYVFAVNIYLFVGV